MSLIDKELEANRRNAQRRENELIGKRKVGQILPEQIDLEMALARFVFISEGTRVADLQSPAWDSTLFEFHKIFCSSVERVITKKGDREVVNSKPITEMWLNDPLRKTTISRTFKAGGERFLDDPDGKPSLNTWAGFPEFNEIEDYELKETQAHLFFDHIRFLFGDQSEAFLDWLAHIQQKPHELPHFGWIHVATQTGMGRNWVACVLTRLWSGSVAPSFDLIGALKTNFNGELSRKVLAIVDEIHEGGSGKQWEHAEKLKELITLDKRQINPKYGRKSCEFNSCRWLIFSNHLSAIPLERNDRRFAVKTIEEQPKGLDYYSTLYALMDDPMFLAGVSKILKERDIRHFNAGKTPEMTQDKKALIEQNMGEEDYWCDLLVRYWDSDVITNEQYALLLTGREDGRTPHKNIANRFGIKAYEKPIKLGDKMQRVKVIRNHHLWMNTYPYQLVKALSQLKPIETPRERIESLMNSDDSRPF